MVMIFSLMRVAKDFVKENMIRGLPYNGKTNISKARDASSILESLFNPKISMTREMTIQNGLLNSLAKEAIPILVGGSTMVKCTCKNYLLSSL